MKMLIEVNGLEEARVAIEAVEAYRNGTSTAIETRLGKRLEDRILAVLTSVPLKPTALMVLKLLHKAPPETLVPVESMVEAFIAAGHGTCYEEAWPKVRAALATLSILMKEKLPASDTAGLGKAIDVMAMRHLIQNKRSYKLKEAGRRALEAFIPASCCLPSSGPGDTVAAEGTLRREETSL